MSIQKELITRSENCCELCDSPDNLQPYPVAPHPEDHAAHCVYACTTCRTQLENPDQVATNHWRCLNDSIWSEVPAVKVLSYRMLHQLRDEAWARELMEIAYLEEETLAWAKEGIEDENAVKHIDSNGNILQAGDSVVLIQDLKVKGANFIAKRGTAVRRISLVHDNPEHIEGKVDGQQIVILTKYVKKSK